MLRLRGKLLAGLGGLLVTLVAVCLLCNLIVRRYARRIETLLDQDYQSAVACQSMKESLEGLLDLAQRRVANDTSATSEEVEAVENDFNRSLAKQASVIDAPGEPEATERLTRLWKN